MPALDDAASYDPGHRTQRARPYADSLPRGLTRAWRLAPWPIVLITGVAAALRFAQLSGVSPNEFYDAAVRSMSMSWRNFLFGSFDPSGLLSIDKPPLDLWLQVVSVKLLGWNQFALKLPEALAGTLAVPLLYDAIRRPAGRAAGLAAAAALAVAPESVLTARSDTMDAVMMLLVVAALWLTIRACQTGERRSIVLAGVALGVAFNVKLLEGMLCLPALAVLYLLAAPGAVSVRRRLVDLGLGAVALVGVAVAWALPVSLWPGRHPWPIGSSDGTVWNAMFVFNGVGKVSGTPDTRPGGPGPFRLMVSTGWHYDQLFGCVLVAALTLGLVAVGVAAWRAWAGGGAGLAGPARALLRPAPAADRLRASLAVALAVWMVLGLVVFDTIGTVHARYLDALAPALAAVIGLGAASLAGLSGVRPDARRPALAASAGALGLVCAYSFHFHVRSASWGSLCLLIAAVGAGLVASAGGRLLAVSMWLLAGLLVAGTLAYPVHSTLVLVRSHENDSLGLAVTSPANAQALSRYLGPLTSGAHYELAVDEPLQLAQLIITDQRPLLPLTSWGGRRLLGLTTLLAAVRAGQVRYGLVAAHGHCGSRRARPAACGPAARWIRRHGTDVTDQAGLSGPEHLYQLPGAGSAAAAG